MDDIHPSTTVMKTITLTLAERAEIWSIELINMQAKPSCQRVRESGRSSRETRVLLARLRQVREVMSPSLPLISCSLRVSPELSSSPSANSPEKELTERHSLAEAWRSTAAVRFRSRAAAQSRRLLRLNQTIKHKLWRRHLHSLIDLASNSCQADCAEKGMWPCHHVGLPSPLTRDAFDSFLAPVIRGPERSGAFFHPGASADHAVARASPFSIELQERCHAYNSLGRANAAPVERWNKARAAHLMASATLSPESQRRSR